MTDIIDIETQLEAAQTAIADDYFDVFSYECGINPHLALDEAKGKVLDYAASCGVLPGLDARASLFHLDDDLRSIVFPSVEIAFFIPAGTPAGWQDYVRRLDRQADTMETSARLFQNARAQVCNAVGLLLSDMCQHCRIAPRHQEVLSYSFVAATEETLRHSTAWFGQGINPLLFVITALPPTGHPPADDFLRKTLQELRGEEIRRRADSRAEGCPA